MWNSRVCRPWFSWISLKSNCLRTFLFWDASILVRLVSLKISLICCCWLFWSDMSMSTLSLNHWTFSSVPPNPTKSHLKTLPKQIVLTFTVHAHLHLHYHQRSGLILSWIEIVNWLSMLRSIWPLQCIQLRFYGMIGFYSFLHRSLSTGEYLFILA